MKKTLLSILFFTVIILSATEVNTQIQQQSIKKDFLIMKSTKSYTEAENFAEEVAIRMEMKYMKEVQYSKETGLTYSRKMCEEGYLEYPCYVARGRYDDGMYISIEYSNAYEGFAKGYYLVIVASGNYAKTILKKVKKYESSAYVKSASIYMGCIH